MEQWHVGCTPCFINGIVWPCWISGCVWTCWIIGIECDLAGSVSGIVWPCWISGIVWSCWIIGIVWSCWIIGIVWPCWIIGIMCGLAGSLALRDSASSNGMMWSCFILFHQNSFYNPLATVTCLTVGNYVGVANKLGNLHVMQTAEFAFLQKKWNITKKHRTGEFGDICRYKDMVAWCAYTHAPNAK